MTTTADVVFAVSGQSLIIDAREGRPSSITSVQVFSADADDTTTAESATTGSASVETNPNTTTSAAAGVSEDDPNLITLTSGTGVLIGRRYRIVSSSGHWEDVEIASGSGTAWTTRHPLVNDYASGASFYSTRCSISLSTSWVSDQNNISIAFSPGPAYRARWVYVVGGVTYVADEYFDLVRYPSRHRITGLDVDSLSPGWMDRLPIDHRSDQGRALISRAWSHVKFDLYKAGVDDSAMRNAEMLDELVASRASLLLLEDQVLAGGTADLTLATDVYQRRFAGLVDTPRLSIDKSGGGGATTQERSRPFLIR